MLEKYCRINPYTKMAFYRNGTKDTDAVTPVTPELILWAEKILVMEQMHRNKLRKRFKNVLNGQKIICLGIPDDYEYMDPELIKILLVKVPQLLKWPTV